MRIFRAKEVPPLALLLASDMVLLCSTGRLYIHVCATQPPPVFDIVSAWINEVSVYQH